MNQQAGVVENAILSAFVTGSITKVNVTNPKTGVESDIVLEGLAAFFS